MNLFNTTWVDFTIIEYETFIDESIILNLLILYSNCILSQIPTQQFNVGDDAPAFKHIDYKGNIIDSEQLVTSGKLVVMFYRGNWCPVCMRHLSKLQDSLHLISEKGANVVLITPENAKNTEETIKKTKGTFTVIPDTTMQILKAFKVDYKIDLVTVPKYYDYVLNGTKKGNNFSEPTLPVPATFIINQNNKFDFIQFNHNYI